MERNLYGRILCNALVESIDMSLAFTYSITPVPLSMCHFGEKNLQFATWTCGLPCIRFSVQRKSVRKVRKQL